MNAKLFTTEALKIPVNDNSPSNGQIFLPLRKQWWQRFGSYSFFAAFPTLLVSNVQARANETQKTQSSSFTAESARVLKWLNKSCGQLPLLKRRSEYRLPHQLAGFDWLTPLAGNDDCPGFAIPLADYTATSPFIDSGNTTGANNTVNSFGCCFYYHYNTEGPDHIYSFTLSRFGPNPQIQVSTSSSSYRPLIYVLLDGSRGVCPAGTPNVEVGNWISSESAFGGGTATLSSSQMLALPLNVPLYLFIDSRVGGPNGSGPYTVRIQDVSLGSSEACPNPIDCPGFYVRQHYLDLLNRLPDPGGLAYWTNEITRCGNDAVCIHLRRIDVSAAFFIEPEFQEAGYFVYRFYKVSFNRRPNFSEFISDHSAVSGGANLEANKQAFTNQWVARPAFVAAFPVTMSSTEYVNKLFDLAGLTASRYNPLRQQEIAAMNSGRSRALVLRDVIEIPDFKNIADPNDPRYGELKQISQFNPAFVLMQYFGYLRRDVDPAGYDFWLDVVNNREPNNYRAMVCAFITSTEYQSRFGSPTRSNADCAQ